MNKYLFFCIVVLLCNGCTTTSTITTNSNLARAANFAFDPNAGYVPIEPETAKTVLQVNENNELVDKDIRLLNSSQLLRELNNVDANVTVGKVDTEFGLSYLTGSITAGKGTYVAVLDFANYFIDDLVDEQGKKLGSAKIGIGLRLIADVKTKKSGIDLGSVFKIGLAASRNELSGRMTVKVIGMTSPEIINLVPGNISSINETAIQTALESMAAVKSKIYEQDTVVSAKILSVKLDPKEVENTGKLVPAKI